MSDEKALTRREVLVRQKARLLEGVAAKVAVIDSEIAEIDQLAALASKHGYSLTPVPGAAGGDIQPGSLTIEALIERYRTAPDSPFHTKKFYSRQNANSLCNIIIGDIGSKPLADIDSQEILRFYENAISRGAAKGRGGDGKAIAEALVGQLRTLFNYGGKVLQDRECVSLSFLLRDLREQMGLKGVRLKPKSGGRLITAEEAIAIRRKAHMMDWPSMALAQAFLFDAPFLVRDVIGEWMPAHESDQSEAATSKPIISENQKWIRGFRWEDISPDGILRHSAGRVLKPVDFDLRKNARMVMEELIGRYGSIAGLPSEGPIIVIDKTGVPYSGNLFREHWLRVARAANVPDSVSNRHGYATKNTSAASDSDDTDESEETWSGELPKAAE
jgi:hypothetical protein